jgi:predicted SAM-dependent methyltransferase
MKRRFLIKNKYKKLKVNLGCGFLVEKDSIGIDKRDCGQEIVWDIRDGLPFEDNSVDIVCSCHFLEHLTDSENMDLFEEIYRVLKKGGTTEHLLPHAKDSTAMYFGHKILWDENRVNSLAIVMKGFKMKSNAIIKDGGRGSKYELYFLFEKL